MKKRILVWFVIGLLGCAAIVALILGVFRHSLVHEMNRVAEFGNRFEVVSVEVMAKHMDPALIDISEENELYDELIKEIKKTKVRFVRKEISVKFSDPLYTFTAKRKGKRVSVSVESNEMLHINQNNATYVVVSKNCKLYDILKEISQEVS